MEQALSSLIITRRAWTSLTPLTKTACLQSSPTTTHKAWTCNKASLAIVQSAEMVTHRPPTSKSQTSWESVDTKWTPTTSNKASPAMVLSAVMATLKLQTLKSQTSSLSVFTPKLICTKLFRWIKAWTCNKLSYASVMIVEITTARKPNKKIKATNYSLKQICTKLFRWQSTVMVLTAVTTTHKPPPLRQPKRVYCTRIPITCSRLSHAMVLSVAMVTLRPLILKKRLVSSVWPNNLTLHTRNICSRVFPAMVLSAEMATPRPQTNQSQTSWQSVDTKWTPTPCNKASPAMVLSAEMMTPRPQAKRQKEVLELPDINKIPTPLSYFKLTKPCTARTSEIE